MEIRAGIRREPPTDLGDVGEDALVERIREEIRSAGPMPFARFMGLALYDPDGGYYRSATARAGRAGDFITAPELHPIFGATLADGVVDIWDRLGRPDPFVVHEHGAGDGALAVALLGELASGPLGPLVRYRPVEVDPRRIDALRDRLRSVGLGDALLTTAPSEPTDGIVIANEVLDALPVHRVRQRDGILRELAVAVDPAGAFIEQEIEPTTPALAERLAAERIALVDGQTAELCLELDRWIAEASADLARGVLILIDYGAPAPELYDPVRRRDGTLRAYLRHQVHGDPFRHVGRQDLTAHVDVTAVEGAAHRAGLSTLGTTTQAEALVSLGIEGRLQAIQADRATTFEEYAVVRSSLMRMLDPSAMGRFRVMVFGRGWPDLPASGAAPLRLFSFRQPARATRG